jgi:sec-independent protein translocase protein TatA
MGIGFRELLVILAIALLVFGAGKLKNIGSDLGAAVRGFKKGMSDEEETTKDTKAAPAADDNKKA